MKPLDPRLLRRSRSVRRHLVTSVVLGLATAAAIIAQAMLITRIVTDRFDGEGQAVAAAAVALALCVGLRALIGWAHDVVSARAAARVKAELRVELVEDLLDPRRLGPRPESGSLVALLGPGLDAFDGYVGRFLPQVVLAALVPAMVLVTIGWADPLSAVIVGFTLPLIVVFMVLVGLLTRDRLDRRWKALERLGRHFADVLDGLVVLKIFGRSSSSGLREVGERHRKASVQALRLAFLSSFVLELFATLAVALVAVSVGLRVVDGDLALGTGLLVLLLAPEAFGPLRRLGALFHDSSDGAQAVERALQVLDHPRHTGHAPVPDLREADIVLTGVRIQHEDRSGPSLAIDREVVRPGEVVVVAGPSGTGKSTLLDVLLGWQQPTSGRVTVGGVDLASIDPVAWRSHIAWVPQAPGLVRGTVADNVRLGCAAATDAQVLAALVAVDADILGLQRHVSEGGLNLSAGERRRVAMARALVQVQVAGARLLLLDEPTAGLDAGREASVLAALLEATRAHGVTAVVVTHRPTMLGAGDRVVRLDRAAVPA